MLGIPKLFETKDSIKKEQFLKSGLDGEVLVTQCHVCPGLPGFSGVQYFVY